MPSTSVFRVRSEFDDFLFAPIDDDGKEMLSVLSALTQLDFDPWQEASELAKLSSDKATRKLAALLALLPDRPSAPRDVGRITARLIALLPRGAAPSPRNVAIKFSGVNRRILFVILTAFVLGLLWVISR